MSTKTTTQYPLLFGFQERIFGNGFVASIQVHGQATAEEETDGAWWVYGVTPGAVAGTGSSLGIAVAALRERMKSAFVDCAEEADDFATFKTSVEAFFNATDREAEVDWENARLAVRSGAINRPDLDKAPDPRPPSISVEHTEITPRANVVDDDVDVPCLAA